MKAHTPWSDEASAPFVRSRRGGGHASLVDALLDITCRFTECSHADLVGRTRTRVLVEARTAVYIAIRVLSEESVSYPTLGRVFGRNYTTVITSIQSRSRLSEEMAEAVIEAYEAEAMARPKLRVVGE